MVFHFLEAFLSNSTSEEGRVVAKKLLGLTELSDSLSTSTSSLYTRGTCRIRDIITHYRNLAALLRSRQSGTSLDGFLLTRRDGADSLCEGLSEWLESVNGIRTPIKVAMMAGDEIGPAVLGSDWKELDHRRSTIPDIYGYIRDNLFGYKRKPWWYKYNGGPIPKETQMLLHQRTVQFQEGMRAIFGLERPISSLDNAIQGFLVSLKQARPRSSNAELNIDVNVEESLSRIESSLAWMGRE